VTWTGPGIKDFYPLVPSVSRLWLDVRVPRHMPFAAFIASVRRVYKLRRIFRTLKPDVAVSFIDISNIYTILARAAWATGRCR